MRWLWPIVVAAGLAALAAGCGGADDPPALPEGRFVAAEREIQPRIALFADPLVARVDLIVDRDKYDPDRVRLATDFEPWESGEDVVRTRKDLGRYTHLHYEYTLRCLVYDCLPEIGGGPPQVQPGGLPPPLGTQGGGFGERKTFNFKDARVLYDDPDGGAAQLIRDIAWPPVQSVSRLNLGDTEVTGIGFPFSAEVVPLPEASYRVTPAVLGIGLLAIALALLALPATLVARSLRKEPEPEAVPERELTPLEKALARVESARGEPEAERREALEALALELEAEESELAPGARRLAWAPTVPSAEAMDLLVGSVKEAHVARDAGA
jgi:hypothetical protein